MIYREKPENFDIRFGVAACYLVHGSRFLMLKRHPDKPHGGTWALPAGKVEAGETDAEAIVRELREELGLSIDLGRLERLPSVYVEHDEGNLRFTYAMFKCVFEHAPAFEMNPRDHTDLRWCTPEEALRLHLIPDEDACIKLCYGLP